MIPGLQALLYCLLAQAVAVAVAAFSVSPSFVHRKPLLATATNSNHKLALESKKTRVPRLFVIVMRDASASYWFQWGDTVQVVADNVAKSGINLQSRIGRVVETWEKCDVDPTCCCAEQVDIHMAVRVEFQGTESDPNAPGTSFVHYFAEDELLKVVPAPSSLATMAMQEETEHKGATTASLPFDGMTCTAFKLDHLQSASQKQRNIYKWEPGAPQLAKEEDGQPTTL
jgi:hypothetical protein